MPASKYVLVQHIIKISTMGSHRHFSERYGLGYWKNMITKRLSNPFDSLSLIAYQENTLRWTIIGSNLVNRSKSGTKRHILKVKQDTSLSAIISSARTHDIKPLIYGLIIQSLNNLLYQTYHKKELDKYGYIIYLLIKHTNPNQ